MSATAVNDVLQACLKACEEHEDELGQLDAVAGDGDHGSGMVRGFTAACSATAALDGPVDVCVVAAGLAFGDAAGGASGALWGVFLQSVGRKLGDGAMGPGQVVEALRHGESQLERLGKSQPGDKTLLDTLAPFIEALDARVSEGTSLSAAWSEALVPAHRGTQATSRMIAKRGRSAVLGERSMGTMDPGARSLYLVLEAVGRVILNYETEAP